MKQWPENDGEHDGSVAVQPRCNVVPWRRQRERRGHASLFQFPHRWGLGVLAMGALWLVLVDSAFLVAQSLDEQLFEDLTESAPSETREGASPADPPAEVPLQQDGDGKDLVVGRTRPAGDDLNVGETIAQMHLVGERLARKDTSSATREMQLRIVGEIDSWIQALSERESPPGKDREPQSTGTPSSSATAPTPSEQPGVATPTPSTSDTQRGQPEPAGSSELQSTRESRDQLLQSSWGNLPPAAREQMQSARPERFLPKYERLIEDYFRRLAETPE